jgi:hypothetical protein
MLEYPTKGRDHVSADQHHHPGRGRARHGLRHERLLEGQAQHQGHPVSGTAGPIPGGLDRVPGTRPPDGQPVGGSHSPDRRGAAVPRGRRLVQGQLELLLQAMMSNRCTSRLSQRQTRGTPFNTLHYL